MEEEKSKEYHKGSHKWISFFINSGIQALKEQLANTAMPCLYLELLQGSELGVSISKMREIFPALNYINSFYSNLRAFSIVYLSFCSKSSLQKDSFKFIHLLHLNSGLKFLQCPVSAPQSNILVF